MLRSAELTGHAEIEAGQMALDGLSGRVDGAPLAGSLSLHAGARPGVKAALAVERLELDPWLPDGCRAPPPGCRAFAGADARI